MSRLSYAARTRLDVLLDESWELAERVFLEPTDDEARKQLRAKNVEIEEARAAEESKS